MTKEEKEFECPNCRTRFEPIPKVNAHEIIKGNAIDYMKKEIDRLEAQVKELEREKVSNFSRRVADGITKNAAITDYCQQIERLGKYISDLRGAAEPIRLRLVDPSVGPDDCWIMVRRKEIEKLAECVRGERDDQRYSG